LEDAEAATLDLVDVLRADLTIVFTSHRRTRGGHLVEMGVALGAGRPAVVVGPYRPVFSWLPTVRVYADWPAAKESLA